MVVALLTDAANRAIDIANTLEPLQRMGFLWTWCLGGILFAVQMSQIGEPTQWTKLTREQTCVLLSVVAAPIPLEIQLENQLENQLGNQLEKPRLTDRRPYWLTFYGFQFVMLTFGAFPVFRDRLDGLCFGYEENVLNGILIGFIALEAALVFYATLHFLTRGGRVAAQPKKA